MITTKTDPKVVNAVKPCKRCNDYTVHTPKGICLKCHAKIATKLMFEEQYTLEEAIVKAVGETMAVWN